MNNKFKNIFIFIGIVLFIAVLFFYFFERKLVPNADYSKTFSPKSKQVYGLSVFTKLLKDKMGDSKVIVDYNFKFASSNNLNTAALVWGDDIYASEFNNPTFINFLQNGNDLFLFGDNISIMYDSVKVQLDTSIEIKLVDTFYHQNNAYPFNFKLLHEDSLSQRNMINLLDCSIYYRYEEDEEIEDEYDELSSGTYVDSTSNDTAYNDTASIVIDSQIVEENENKNEHLAMGNDSLCAKVEQILTYKGKPVFQKIKAYNGNIYIHSVPKLFTNIATEDATNYAHHFNLLTSFLKNKKIIITTEASIIGAKNDSPLAFILNNRSLASAYYLALIIGILYLIFGGKRIMKAIPIIDKVTNTSLEYTNTLAKLYQKQGQPGRLVKKMEENFYFTMNKKFNVHRSDENFIKVLSKKSKISESLIYSAVKYFDEIERQKDCSNEQLEMLNNYLTNIEKQMNHGNKQ